MASSRKRNHDDDLNDKFPKLLRGGGGYGDDADDLFNDDDLFEDNLLVDQDGPAEPEEDEDIAFGDITNVHRSRWSRPAVPLSVWKTSENDLNLQWLDIDMIGGTPLAKNPNKDKKVLGASSGTVPIIRLYGVNETGNSVAVFIHGFTAYGYFALPRGYDVDGSDGNLGKIRSILEENLRAKLGSQFDKGDNNSNGESIMACLGVTCLSNKQSIMGYDPSHTKFLKVYVAMPGMIPKLKSIMEEGITLPGITNANGQEVRESMIFQPFECNVPYVMRYMIDRDITGASWLSLLKGTYHLRHDENEKGTHCQVRDLHL
jgi:DNA polymerase delta subunit 1